MPTLKLEPFTLCIEASKLCIEPDRARGLPHFSFRSRQFLCREGSFAKIEPHFTSLVPLFM